MEFWAAALKLREFEFTETELSLFESPCFLCDAYLAILERVAYIETSLTELDFLVRCTDCQHCFHDYRVLETAASEFITWVADLENGTEDFYNEALLEACRDLENTLKILVDNIAPAASIMFGSLVGNLLTLSSSALQESVTHAKRSGFMPNAGYHSGEAKSHCVKWIEHSANKKDVRILKWLVDNCVEHSMTVKDLLTHLGSGSKKIQ